MPVKRIATLFIFVIFFTCFFVKSYAGVKYNFIDTNGQSYNSKDFKNKWVIINYWASWCDSCIDEVPELNKFYFNNKNSNIVILGVNYDHLRDPHLTNAIDKLGIRFPVLKQDPGKELRLGVVSVLPTTFVINPNGDIVKKIIGANTEQSLLKIVHNQMYVKKIRDFEASDIKSAKLS